ncbi:unnamed protein product [Rangifer tarandus platyrhynchus]|uniref:Uncharacterized protein n=1 Tax=Rangifer tarandus platyrhynchus TaxID=3082113 RepID=A0ABN8Z6K0_RANTA|nr:unnamed protein product [Rangifer tarandus platyrhynchus]CAI9687970.1 unnamed protein product [Rangifer tarandus platyrhynchus]
MTGLCLALGRPDRRGPPRRLRCPAPPAPPHRLGRVATAAAAAAAANTSSRHSPAPRTLRARRGRGPKPYSDWLRAGQPPLEAADIGGNEADEQPLKPITEGWRRDYWERQWGPPGGPAGREALGGEGPEAGEDWSRGGRRAALMANGWGSRAGLRRNLRDWAGGTEGVARSVTEIGLEAKTGKACGQS